jgi:hypothetical protein
LGKKFDNALITTSQNTLKYPLNVSGSCYHIGMNEKQLKALMAQIVRANSAKIEAEKKK